MDTLITIAAILGFFAWLGIFSLQSRISKLERQLRQIEGTEASDEAKELRRIAKVSIGKTVKLSFRENEGDYDLYGDNSVTILDADNEWVLVEFTLRGKPVQKLIRQSAIRGITEA